VIYLAFYKINQATQKGSVVHTGFGIIILLLIFVLQITGQDIYPADSLLSSSKVFVLRKIGILPIAGWQRLSYNSDALNCQYYPSCSNYAAHAIAEKGLILGSFMAADRIMRCNPSALENHLKAGRGLTVDKKYLIDPIHLEALRESTKSPALAVLFSALVPGTGRAYAGRTHDAFTGFMLFAFSATFAVQTYREERPIAAPIFIGLATLIYGGEIYGAYRTAKYYQPPSQP
jgi:putative component of membrane protein insertase Oxa1/YidC/SpoIIIJ protein YidD